MLAALLLPSSTNLPPLKSQLQTNTPPHINPAAQHNHHHPSPLTQQSTPSRYSGKVHSRATMAPPSPPPPRRTALLPLLLMALLLLSVVAHAGAARVQVVVPAAATSRGRHAELYQGHRTEVVAAVDGNPCAGEEDEAADQEECLVRRTLEAHTDYIYTQSGGHS